MVTYKDDNSRLIWYSDLRISVGSHAYRSCIQWPIRNLELGTACHSNRLPAGNIIPSPSAEKSQICHQIYNLRCLSGVPRARSGCLSSYDSTCLMYCHQLLENGYMQSFSESTSVGGVIGPSATTASSSSSSLLNGSTSSLLDPDSSPSFALDKGLHRPPPRHPHF